MPLVHAPSGDRPKTWACNLTRKQTGHLLLCGMRPKELSHTSQGKKRVNFILPFQLVLQGMLDHLFVVPPSCATIKDVMANLIGERVACNKLCFPNGFCYLFQREMSGYFSFASWTLAHAPHCSPCWSLYSKTFFISI